MKYLAAFMIAFLLAAGCASPPPAGTGQEQLKLSPERVDAGPFPQDYQTRIIAWLRMNAADPDSLRILSISEPQPARLSYSIPEKDLREGEAMWVSTVYTSGFSGDPPGAVPHTFYFKQGVIRAVDLK
jgi:hypothetical protein